MMIGCGNGSLSVEIPMRRRLIPLLSLRSPHGDIAGRRVRNRNRGRSWTRKVAIHPLLNRPKQFVGKNLLLADLDEPRIRQGIGRFFPAQQKDLIRASRPLRS